METVIRVPGESSGLTVTMFNFGSGVSATSGFSVCYNIDQEQRILCFGISKLRF